MFFLIPSVLAISIETKKRLVLRTKVGDILLPEYNPPTDERLAAIRARTVIPPATLLQDDSPDETQDMPPLGRAISETNVATTHAASVVDAIGVEGGSDVPVLPDGVTTVPRVDATADAATNEAVIAPVNQADSTIPTESTSTVPATLETTTVPTVPDTGAASTPLAPTAVAATTEHTPEVVDAVPAVSASPVVTTTTGVVAATADTPAVGATATPVSDTGSLSTPVVTTPTAVVPTAAVPVPAGPAKVDDTLAAAVPLPATVVVEAPVAASETVVTPVLGASAGAEDAKLVNHPTDIKSDSLVSTADAKDAVGQAAVGSVDPPKTDESTQVKAAETMRDMLVRQ